MSNNLNIGICQWCIPAQGIEAFSFASNMGYKGIVLDIGKAVENFPLSNPEYIIDVLREREKNEICVTTIAINELCRTGMVRSQNYNFIGDIFKKAVDIAETLDVKLLQLPSFGDGFINSEQDFYNTVLCLKNACKIAGEKGIYVGTENALSVQDNYKMQDEVGEPNLKIYFDTANPVFLAGGMYAPDMLSSMIDKICEIHVKDVRRNPVDGKFQFVPLGKGETDFEKSISIIKKSGYKGWIHVENELSEQELRCDREKLARLIG